MVEVADMVGVVEDMVGVADMVGVEEDMVEGNNFKRLNLLINKCLDLNLTIKYGKMC